MNSGVEYYVRGPRSRSNVNYCVRVSTGDSPERVRVTWFYENGTTQHAQMNPEVSDYYVCKGLWDPAPFLQLPEGL